MQVIFYQTMQMLCCVACLAAFVWLCLVMYGLSCGRPPTYWPLRAGIALTAIVGLLKLEKLFDEEAEYTAQQKGE